MAFFRTHLPSIYGLTFLTLATLILIGWSANNAPIAVLLGYTAGLTLDPIMAVIGLLIGAFVVRWWSGIAIAIVAAVLMHLAIVFIDELGTGGPPIGTIVPRTLAILCWASISSLGRTLLAARTRNAVSTQANP